MPEQTITELLSNIEDRIKLMDQEIKALQKLLNRMEAESKKLNSEIKDIYVK